MVFCPGPTIFLAKSSSWFKSINGQLENKQNEEKTNSREIDIAIFGKLESPYSSIEDLKWHRMQLESKQLSLKSFTSQRKYLANASKANW